MHYALFLIRNVKFIYHGCLHFYFYYISYTLCLSFSLTILDLLDILQMDNHVFDCTEACKQQNDILQESLDYNDQHCLFILALWMVGMFSICFIPVVIWNLTFHFQSLLNRNTTYGVWFSTLQLLRGLFIIYLLWTRSHYQ